MSIATVVKNGVEYEEYKLSEEELMARMLVPLKFRSIAWDLAEPGLVRGAGVVDKIKPGKLRKDLEWLSTWSNEDPERFVVLSGGYGRGKTTFAAAVMNWCALIKPPPKWVQWPRLVADVTDSWKSRDASECDIIDQYKHLKMITIDDFGKEVSGGDDMRGWQKRIAFEMINTRYEWNLPTIITTELDLVTMSERLDAAMTSRIMENGRWIDLNELPDHRIR